jgi:hypothetical protein
MDDATVRAYLPGTREVALFAGLTLLGLVAWAFSTPSVAGYLFGERFYRAAYSFPLYFGLPLYALLALTRHSPGGSRRAAATCWAGAQWSLFRTLLRSL